MAILAAIEVDDQGSLILKNFGEQLEALGATVKKSSDQTKQSSGEQEKAARSTQIWSQSLGSLHATLQRVTEVLATGGFLYMMKAYSEEAFRIAARNQVLSTSMTIVGRNTGRTGIDMERAAQAIRKLGITTSEARNAVLDFAQANLSLNDASKLARAAQDLAVIAGKNSSEAFQTLTNAIQTQHPVLLRQFGIVTGLHEVYGKYAREVGKTEKELSAYDKRQAFVNRILDEAKKVSGAYTASMNDVGKAMGSTRRLVEELLNRFGQSYLPTMKLIVDQQNAWLESLAKLPQGVFDVVAAVGTFITVLTGLVTVTRTLMYFMGVSGVAGILSGMKAGLLALLSPWGAVALAIAGAAAAIVYWNTEGDESRERQRELGAQALNTKNAYESQRTAIEKAQANLERMRKAGIDTADAQKRMATEVGRLRDLIPGAVVAFDKLTGEIQFNQKAIDDWLKSANAAIEKGKASAKQRVDTTAAQIDQATRIKDRLDQLAAAGKGNVRVDAFRSVDRKMVSDITEFADGNLTVAQAYEAVRKKLQELNEAYRSANEALRAFTSDAVDNAAAARDSILKDFDSEDLKRFEQQLEKLGLTNKFYKGTEEEVRAAAEAARGGMEKQAMMTARLQQVSENAFKMISGESENLAAKLQGANRAFAGLKVGSEEYNQALQRGRGVILEYGKANEGLQHSVKALGVAYENLIKQDVAKEMREWSKAAADAARELGDTLNGTAMERGLQITEQRREADLRYTEEYLKGARQVQDADRELYEAQIAGKMSAVDQILYAEQKKVAEILRAAEEEKRARRVALDEEAHQLQQRIQNQKFELAAAIEASKQRMEVRYQEQRAMDALNDEFKTEEGRARLARLNVARQQELDGFKKNLDGLRLMYTERLSMDERAQQELLARRREQNAALDALTDEAAQKRVAAARTVSAQQIKDSQFLYRFLREQAQSYANLFLNQFGQILSGAKSFKDVFIGIFQSIKQSVLKIMGDVVNAIIGGLTGIGPGRKGGIAGMKDALTGLFGGAVMLGGGMGSTGAAVGLGGALGAMPAATSGGAFTGLLGSGAVGLMASGGAGGLLGYGLGRLMPNRGAGGLLGAGAGAAAGFALGGPMGALIGGGAGLIGGLFGGGAEARKVKQAREEYIAQAGGIKRIREEAEKAGVSIDRMMATKRMKEFTAEVEKIENGIKVTNTIKGLEAAAGGADRLRVLAKEAGVSLDELYAAGAKAEDVAYAAEKIGKALELQKAKEGIAKTYTELGALSRQAQIVGFDLNKLWNSTTIEEFNGHQAHLNELLEAQQRRMAGLSRAAAGLETRMAGLGALITKLGGDVADGTKPEDALDARLKKITESKEKLDAVKADIAAVGTYLIGIFAGILKETGDIMAAYTAVAGPLDQLVILHDKLGLTAEGTLAKLLEFRRTIKNNEDVAQSLSGINQILEGMADAGMMTQDLFNTFGQDAARQMQILMERGVAADQALLLMQPTLQRLYEAQKRYGFVADETTQKLIQQGIDAGVVGDAQMDVNERIFDVLLIVAEALGATLPDAYQKWKRAATDPAVNTAIDGVNATVGETERKLQESEQAFIDWRNTAVDAAADVEYGVNAVSFGHSPGGIKEYPLKLREASMAFATWATTAVAQLRKVETAVNAVDPLKLLPTPLHENAGGQLAAPKTWKIDIAKYAQEYQTLAANRIEDQFARARMLLTIEREQRINEMREQLREDNLSEESEEYKQHVMAINLLYQQMFIDVTAAEQKAARERAKQHADALQAIGDQLVDAQVATLGDSMNKQVLTLQLDRERKLRALRDQLGAETDEYAQQAAAIRLLYAQLEQNLLDEGGRRMRAEAVSNAAEALKQRLFAFRMQINTAANAELLAMRARYHEEIRLAEEAGETQLRIEEIRRRMAEETNAILTKHGAAREEEFNRLGLIAAATFSSIMAETKDPVKAFNAIAEALAELESVRSELNLTGNAAYTALAGLSATIQSNADLLTAAQGNAGLMKSLDTLGMDPELRAALSADMLSIFKQMVDRGMNTEQAARLLAPQLQVFWERQQLGPLPEELATILAQADALNVIGPEFVDITEQQLSVLQDIYALIATMAAEDPSSVTSTSPVVVDTAAQSQTAAPNYGPMTADQIAAAVAAALSSAGGGQTVQLVIDGRVLGTAVLQNLPAAAAVAGVTVK